MCVTLTHAQNMHQHYFTEIPCLADLSSLDGHRLAAAARSSLDGRLSFLDGRLILLVMALALALVVAVALLALLLVFCSVVVVEVVVVQALALEILLRVCSWDSFLVRRLRSEFSVPVLVGRRTSCNSLASCRFGNSRSPPFPYIPSPLVFLVCLAQPFRIVGDSSKLLVLGHKSHMGNRGHDTHSETFSQHMLSLLLSSLSSRNSGQVCPCTLPSDIYLQSVSSVLDRKRMSPPKHILSLPSYHFLVDCRLPLIEAE